MPAVVALLHWFLRLPGRTRHGLALVLLAPGSAALAGPPPAVIELDARVRPVVPLPGHAQFWIDSSGQLDIDAVVRQGDALDWRPVVDEARYPLDGQVLWFRLRAHQQSAPQRWFIELMDSGIDRAVLYQRSGDGAWHRQEAGDAVPVPHWPVPGRLPTFSLTTKTEAPVDYWLRVEHARVAYSAPIRLISGTPLAVSRDQEQFLLGGYFGLLAMVLMMALALSIAWRDRLMIGYAAYVASVGITQLGQLGTGAQYVWPYWDGWNRLSTFVAPSLSAVVGLLFIRMLTEPARSSVWLDRAVLAVAALTTTLVLLDIAVPLGATYRLIGDVLLLLLALVAVCMALAWRRSPDRHLRLAILGFMPMLLLALFPLARTLGLIATSGLTRYGLAIGAALEMPILLYAIATGVASRREARVRAAASATTDALTGLANLRVLTPRLDGALARADKQGSSFAVLVVHVANWKDIAAAHGLQAAERALVLTASRLRRIAGEVDLAARVSEADFAVLLEAPTTRPDAIARARRIVDEGARDSALLAKGDALALRVSVAMLPRKPLNGAAVLRWMLGAARAGRMGPAEDRVRVLG